MYTLVYYVKRTENEKVYEDRYPGEEFRLKKNALHFLREISKECYIKNGYIVEDVRNGLNCYKRTGARETTETHIRIERNI